MGLQALSGHLPTRLSDSQAIQMSERHGDRRTTKSRDFWKAASERDERLAGPLCAGQHTAAVIRPDWPPPAGYPQVPTKKHLDIAALSA
jgi:hypothetical protein